MTDGAVIACTASRWVGEPGRCRWCDVPLTGRRRRWCSDDCSSQYGRNHFWGWASGAAMKRDGYRCVRCGIPPLEAFELAIRECRHLNARRYRRLEVHHVVPILGRHGVSGCHHHLDGLETLCLFHHLEVHHGVRHEQLALQQPPAIR